MRPDSEKIDLDRIHAQLRVEEAGAEEAGGRAVDDAVDALPMDVLYEFVSDDPVPDE